MTPEEVKKLLKSFPDVPTHPVKIYKCTNSKVPECPFSLNESYFLKKTLKKIEETELEKKLSQLRRKYI